jgi:hypothetical protein
VIVRRRLAVALFLAAVAAVVAVAAGLRREQQQPAAKDDTPGADPAAGVPSPDADEVQRLRAELRTKDALIRALTVQGAAKEAERAAAVRSAMADASRTPAARAVARLDSRLASAPPDMTAKATLERALGPQVGTAHVDELRCAGALCKVALSAANDGDLDAAVSGLSDRLPKEFGATIVLPLEDGERAIFIGRTSADLTVDGAP